MPHPDDTITRNGDTTAVETDVALPATNSFIIELMVEGQNSSFIEAETQHQTVAGFRSEKNLSPTATISVDNVLATDATQLTPGCQVTVVNSAKTGGALPGARTRQTKVSRNVVMQSTNNTVIPHGQTQTVLTQGAKGKTLRYILEHGVPIPSMIVRNGRVSRYPFGQMEVGHSFKTDVKVRSKVQAAMSSFNRRNELGMKFTARTVHEDDKLAYRVWRIS